LPTYQCGRNPCFATCEQTNAIQTIVTWWFCVRGIYHWQVMSLRCGSRRMCSVPHIAANKLEEPNRSDHQVHDFNSLSNSSSCPQSLAVHHVHLLHSVNHLHLATQIRGRPSRTLFGVERGKCIAMALLMKCAGRTE